MSLENRIQEIDLRIARALHRVGRSAADLTLVAVTKKQPIELVRAYCNYRARRKEKAVLGENYVQEFVAKKAQLPSTIEAHLIGHLQSNKIKTAVASFNCIHSAGSLSILQSIDKEAHKVEKIQDLFLQVNISDDDAKGGFSELMLDVPLADHIRALRSIRVLGLMTITRLYESAEDARGDFKRMRYASQRFGQYLKASQPLALSMGMSNDFEIAIEEGATHVRVGSALFGERTT